MKHMILAAALAAFAAGGCKKRQPENVPQPKAEGQAVAMSTPAAPGVLEAPGAYLKATVGQVGKAKAAAAVYEKAAAAGLGAASDAGGDRP